MEAQPTRFMGTVLPAALRDAADRLAAFLGARGEDIAFVDNATSGCNAVLRSLSLRRAMRSWCWITAMAPSATPSVS